MKNVVDKLNLYYDSLDNLYSMQDRLDLDFYICGEKRSYTAFHYPTTNEERPLNVKKHFFIDLNHLGDKNWYLSKYEALGALIIPSYYDLTSGVVVSRRLLISLTPLIHEDDKGQPTPNIYLLQVLSTLCIEALTHFLIYDCRVDNCEIWTTMGKGFQCDIYYIIEEDMMQLLLAKREHFLRIRGMIYSIEKGYIRSIHKPENAQREKELKGWTDDQVAKVEDMWTVILGP